MHGNAPRSRSRIFTYRKMKITTSPFVYRGVAVFMPEKVGNLQPHAALWISTSSMEASLLRVPEGLV